jgi:PAS domain S-box-containing protein
MGLQKFISLLKKSFSLTDNAIILADRDFNTLYIHPRAVSHLKVINPALYIDQEQSNLKRIFPEIEWAHILKEFNSVSHAADENIEIRSIQSCVNDNISYAITANDEIITILITSQHADNPFGVNSELISFFDHLSSGVILTDGSEKPFTYINKGMCTLLGYSFDELKTLTPQHIYPSDNLHKILKKFGDNDGGKRSVGDRIKLKRKDGSICHADVIAIRLESDNPAMYCGIFRDITSRVIAKKRLLESEQRWKFALEGSGEGVWDWNLKNNTVYFSDQWKAMLGYKPEEMGNDLSEWENRVHPDCIDRTKQEIARYLTGESDQYHNEHRILAKDGSFRWILDRGMIVERDKDDNPTRFIGTHSDITQSKKEERELKTIQFGLEHAKIGIYQIDENGVIKFVNKFACQQLGYSKDELLNMSIFDFNTTFDEVSFRFHRMKTREDGSRTIESSHIRKNGTTFPVEITTSYYNFENDIYSFSFVTDITNRKRFETEKEHLVHDLNGRVKELNSLYRLYKLVDNHTEKDLDDFLQKSVALIPEGMQYPDATHARISFNGKEYLSSNKFEESEHRFKSSIPINMSDDTTTVNCIEVFCKNPDSNTQLNPFLKEETELISNFGHIIGHNIDRLVFQYELRLSEEKFKNIFRNHSAVNILIDPETDNIIDANDAAATFYGWNIEQLLSMKITDIIAGNPEVIIDNYIQTNLNKQQFSEFKHRKQDGTLADVEVYNSLIEAEGNKILHSIIHDVTEKKKALEQLTLLSRSVEESPASIIITDRNGSITYVNKGFSKATGYSLEEVKNKNPRILKSGLQDTAFYKDLWETITSGKDWEGEFGNKNKWGDLYWEKAIITPIQNSNGEITHFVAVKEDITEKKFHLDKLEKQNKKLKEIAWTQSHVVRAPLARLLGLINLLEMNEESTKLSGTVILKGIVDSAHEIDKIILNITEMTYNLEDEKEPPAI